MVYRRPGKAIKPLPMPETRPTTPGIVYRYDKDTGEFIESLVAQVQQGKELWPDDNWFKYVIPKDATIRIPPPVELGMARVFLAGSWHQIEDHRGEIWWSGYGKPVTITTLGVPLNLTRFEPPMPVAKMQAEAKAQAKTRLEQTDRKLLQILEGVVMGDSPVPLAKARALVQFRRRMRDIAANGLEDVTDSLPSEPDL